MNPLERPLAAHLGLLESAGLRRQRYLLGSPQSREILIEGRPYLNFSSNDYLGLANDPRVVESLRTGATRYGVGSGGSHLMTGHTKAHHELEEGLAEFCLRERALLFSTGYMANLAVLTTFADRGTAIYQDRLNHASLLDAARLSRALLRRYRHRDAEHLEELLNSRTPAPAIIATDGLFSMEGDLAPLPRLADLALRKGAWLFVDDAHGLGVLGPSGRGSLESFQLSGKDVPILMGTLGKAFGTFGAFVAGSSVLIETLLQRARSYIYTTAIPSPLAAASSTALQLVLAEPWRRTELFRRVQQFRAGLAALGLPVSDFASPIQPLILHTPQRATQVSDRLRQARILAIPIRPPTVPTGQSRLRVTFSYSHTEQDVDHLLEALATATAP